MVKYGELTTKGNNRGTFIKLLESNIKNAMTEYELNITYDYSRMFSCKIMFKNKSMICY